MPETWKYWEIGSFSRDLQAGSILGSMSGAFKILKNWIFSWQLGKLAKIQFLNILRAQDIDPQIEPAYSSLEKEPISQYLQASEMDPEIDPA